MQNIDPQMQSFYLQMEFLKLEWQSINETIKRIDETTQRIKNWAILIWAGSISLLIGQESLRHFTILTAAPPILFWFMDAWWRQIQQRFIIRIRRISQFLNSSRLGESFAQHKLVDFAVIEGQEHWTSDKYKSSRSVLHTMWFPSVGVFYVGLILLSVALWLFFILGQRKDA